MWDMSPPRSHPPSAARSLPFTVSFCWGGDARKAVAYILLAEFDIDSGSTLRHQFPSAVPGHEADWFAEKMLPEGVHNREQDFTFFFLNHASPKIHEIEPTTLRESDPASSQQPDSEAVPDPPSPSAASSCTTCFLYGLNIVRTKFDASVRRGAVVKALAICSPYHFVDAFRAPMMLALDEYFNVCSLPTGDGGLSVLQRLYDSLNGLDILRVPRPTRAERGLMRRGVTAKGINEQCRAYTPKEWMHTTSVLWSGRRIPVTIPLYLSSDEVLSSDHGLIIQLVRVFREGTARIYNAVLTRKRVIFVGHNHAAVAVCRFVLAAASLVSPPLPGIMHRVIPYTSLSDLGFLNVPGYIAGVTNPMFESKEEWWDLLCVLDLPEGTGKCYTPGERAAEEQALGMGEKPPRDETEISTHDVDAALISRVLSGIEARLGEDWVKNVFLDYTQSLLELALDGATQTSGSRVAEEVKKIVSANELRTKAIQKLPEFEAFDPDPWKGIPNLPVRGTVLRSHLRLLELQAQISEQETELIFSDLSKALQSEPAIQIFLNLVPETRGGLGLSRIASALLHSFQPVRFYACLLLQRLEAFDSTRPAVECLNKLLLMAYRRVTEEMTAA